MNKWRIWRQSTDLYQQLAQLDLELAELRQAHSHFSREARKWLDNNERITKSLAKQIRLIESRGRLLRDQREFLAAHISYLDSRTANKSAAPPQLGERILLLILTKEERVNIPGDLEEEYRGIATKHGERYAKLWYYKQVAASAWPMIRKAARWGLLASVGEWIRRYI